MKSISKKRQDQFHRAAAGPPPGKHRCANHLDRIPATSRNGVELCWECSLPLVDYERKCNANYYQPGGPGYAGKEDMK